MKHPYHLNAAVEFKISEFLAMPPFPGHRDSAGRAKKAEHLFQHLPEHDRVDLARLVDEEGRPVLDANGREQIWRMTGNTRAEIWRCGHSDEIPARVIADIYDCRSVADVLELGTHFDSRKAAWTAQDHGFRAFGIAYNEQFRPRSAVFKRDQSKVMGAVRRVDAISRGHLSSKGSEETENILPAWREEVMLLDSILETPIAQSIQSRGPIRVATLAAMILLLRLEPYDQVRAFVVAFLRDEGTKNGPDDPDPGYDGIQLLVESLGPQRSRGKSSFTAEIELMARFVTCFQLWQANERRSTTKGKSVDLPPYYAEQMKKRTAGQKATQPMTAAAE